MNLLSRFVGIWMVFAIYVAVGVEGADYGDTCTGPGTGDCTEKTNTMCDTTCKCTATSFRKSTPECAPKIVLKAVCTASQPSDQCEDTNAECPAGNTCVCKSGFFADKDSKCSAQILLNAACTASQPADQCADALAACASGNTCLCKPGNFENKAGKCAKQIAALDEPCVVSEPASDQCAVDNAECTTNGTAKCQCKVTHYVNVAACAIRKSPTVSCGSGECVTHASCDSGTSKCVCDAGYDPSPTVSPTMCSGVGKVITQSYMYLVPIIVSMVLLLR